MFFCVSRFFIKRELLIDRPKIELIFCGTRIFLFLFEIFPLLTNPIKSIAQYVINGLYFKKKKLVSNKTKFVKARKLISKLKKVNNFLSFLYYIFFFSRENKFIKNFFFLYGFIFLFVRAINRTCFSHPMPIDKKFSIMFRFIVFILKKV